MKKREQVNGPASEGWAIANTYAAAEALAPIGTEAIVFKIWDAIW